MAAAVELTAGTGAGGWVRCGASVDVGEMGTATATAHLFEAVATGLGGARGDTAAWRWAVLPAFPLSTNVSAPSVSQQSETKCVGASVPLTVFAVVSWLLVAGLVGTLALRREQLEAGLNPVKARLKQAEASTRQISFSASKQLEVVPTRSAKRAVKKKLKKEKAASNMVVHPAMDPMSPGVYTPGPVPNSAATASAGSPSKRRKPQGRRRSKKGGTGAPMELDVAPNDTGASPFAIIKRKQPSMAPSVSDRYKSGAQVTNPAFATIAASPAASPFALVKRAPPKSTLSVSEQL